MIQNECFDFLLFTALQVEIDLKSLYFLSFHYMLFSRLQVSPEVTVLIEISPRLLFNVHGHRSGHMQAL